MRRASSLSLLSVGLPLLVLYLVFKGVEVKNSYALPKSVQRLEQGGPQGSFEAQLSRVDIASVEQVKQDMRTSPTAVPASVLKSAKELEGLSRGISSEEEASLFLSKMKSCLQEAKKHPLSIQAICIQFSKKAFKKYPALYKEFRLVMGAASAEAHHTASFTSFLTHQ